MELIALSYNEQERANEDSKLQKERVKVNTITSIQTGPPFVLLGMSYFVFAIFKLVLTNNKILQTKYES